MGEIVLVKGQNVPVASSLSSLRLSVRWSTTADPVDVDVVALILGSDRRVRSDADMVFYNQPATADGSVVLAGKVAADAGGSGDVLVDLSAIEPDVCSLTVVATTNEATLSDLEMLEWLVIDERANPLARFPVAGVTTERALVVGEVYRRNDGWRLRAVGQGWQGGLAGLATDYGVDVDSSDGGVDGEAESDIAPEVDAHAAELKTGEANTATADPIATVAPVTEPPPPEGPPGEIVTSPHPSVGRSKRVRVVAPKPVALVPHRLAEDPAWQESRLFSISGIGGADEQEKRATSALLWTMAAVRPLGRALTARAGAPVGALESTPWRWPRG